MNHPHHDEWALYLEGEAAPADAQRLTEHLCQCPACAAEIAGWRRTIAKLDAWQLPAFQSQRRFEFPFLKWAAAAAIVLSLGFAAGRLTAPAIASMVRAQMTESLTAELRQQVKSKLSAELASQFATMRQEITNEVHQQFANRLDQATARAVEASNRETRQLAGDLIQALDHIRTEDQQATQALFQRVQERQDRDFISLRSDLETVASRADDELKDARLRLIQLAASTQTDK